MTRTLERRPTPEEEPNDRARSLIGVSAARKEDDRLLRGDGQFTDDVEPAHVLEMAVGRSPFPHARVLSIDTSAAAELAGVKHILVRGDVRAASQPLTVLRPVPGAPKLPYYALAQDIVRYEGEPVVSVVATSRAVAEDAIELIDIDYEPIPHVSDTLEALDPAAPVIHPEVLDSNLLVANPEGRGDPEARFAAADVVVEGRFRINRVTGLPMEPRAVVALWRPGHAN